MPLCPQITNTPITVVQNYPVSAVTFNGSTATYTAVGNDFAAGNQVVIAGLVPITFNGTFTISSVAGANFTVPNTQQFAVTAVSFTSTTATYTAAGHNYEIGQSVTVSGLAPAGYNGTFTITSRVAGSTFTVSNGTNAAVTDQNGSVITAAVTDQNGTASIFTVSSILPVVVANTEQLATTDAAVAAAVATANAAAATAGTAQTTANTALTNAATAYTAAIGSLQPSANTIVNASNQMTAIAANGITVYSGASASSGARVVMNSLGLAGFNAAGSATFSISASTGAAVFSGSVTGSTITGGTLNIAGKTIIDSAGLLTGTDVTLTGTINALSGYFGTSTNGFSINSTGLVGVGSGIIVGGTIATAASGQRITLNSSGDNAIKIFPDSSSQPGYISATSVSGQGALRINGPFTSGWNNSNIQLYSLASTTSYIQLTGDVVLVSGGFSVTQGSLFSGSAQFSSTITYPGVTTGAGTTMVVVTTGSRVAIVTSSERFKEQIKYINTTGWLDKVMQMKPITYKTSEDFTTEGEPNDEQIGFLAEDIYDIGGDLEKAVILDPLGDPFSLSYDRLTVFLMLAIKELKAEIDQLKGE
jgi:hypothetical protein